MNAQSTLDAAEPSNEAVFLQKLNRILTDDLDVTVQDYPDDGSDSNNIGGADAKNIFLNFKRISRDAKSDEEAITILKAVNLHELSHVEWTDISAGDVLSRNHNELRTHEALKVAETAIKDAMNILEDARIENLRAAQYPNGGKYFLYQVMRYILKEYYKVRQAKADNQQLNELRARNAMRSAFTLTYGRKFINPIIVAEIETALLTGGHETKQNTEKTKRLIDDYLLAKSLTERIRVAVSFAKHIFGNQTKSDDPKQQNGGIGGAGNAPKYSPSPTNKTNKPKTRSQESKKQENELQESVAEAIKTLNTPANKRKVKASGSSKSGSASVDSMDAIDDLIKTAASTIKTTTDRLAKEIKTTMEELRGKAQLNFTNEEVITPTPYTPSESDKILSTRLLQLLRRVRNDLTSRYITSKPAGRLDIRRVINTKMQSAKVFRKYQHSALGRSKMAVSLLIDASGSMRTDDRYQHAIGAAWSIEKALSTGGDYTQVLDYSHDMRILKSFHHRSAKWDGTPNGPTRPTTALKHALKTHTSIKHAKNIRTHIVVVLTDGDFTDGQNSDPVIAKMNKNGIVTVLIRINSKNTPVHNFTTVRDITEAKEVEPVIQQIIQQVQNKLIRETR
jgi:hypothetical protein